MDVKPIPKPRSMVASVDRPVPAPRRAHLIEIPAANVASIPILMDHTQSSSIESSKSENESYYANDDDDDDENDADDDDDDDEQQANKSHCSSSAGSSCESKYSTNSEFLKNLGASSRQLKDEISEKMTVKGRAVISKTRNASIRLEKSVKSLLTRRLTGTTSAPSSVRHNSEQDYCQIEDCKLPNDENRSVSLTAASATMADDIFSRLSFYSPLEQPIRTNLSKRIKNEQDLSLTDSRYSPPPPVYPPPPLPDESIYDELQSVTSGSQYDTLGSNFEINFPDAETFDYVSPGRAISNNDDDSDESLNLSEVSRSLAIPCDDQTNDVVNDKGTEKLSRSDSWTFYDGIDRPIKERLIMERISASSDTSQLSLSNSLYENWIPIIGQGDYKTAERSALKLQDLEFRAIDRHTESLLSEFDPCAKIMNEACANHEPDKDFMLLESLLSPSSQQSATSSSASATDLRMEILSMEEEEEEQEDQLENDPESAFGISSARGSPIESHKNPPAPPKRYDSLPKNEYDEVEIEQQQDILPNIRSKNPALLPKLIHLAGRKQPAVPPRKAGTTIPQTDSNDNATSSSNSGTIVSSQNNNKDTTEKSIGRTGSVMQRLKKLSQDSTAHVKPNVMNFMKNSKLLSRNRDHGEADRGGADVKRKNSNAAGVMKRPDFHGQFNTVTHRGIVYRSGVGIERARDLVMRAAVLADRKIYFYADKSMSVLKEVVDLEHVLSVHLLQDVKMIEGETVYCIAVSSETRVYVFYAKGITERRIWAQNILEALTPIFPNKYTAELTRVGWAYIKEGVTGSWFPVWLLLQQRTLVYTKCSAEPNVEFEHVDLRKARCILLREEEGPSCHEDPKNKDESGMMPVVVVVVDAAGDRGSIHIATQGTRESSAWRHTLHQAATSCGPALDQQQLTQDNVPVILDKCINFVYAHGIMSEGIYRRSGSSSAVVRLLEAFRRDAWATQITRGSYSEHDVATVLRRFLRDLPAPLLPSSMHDPLCEIANGNVETPQHKTTSNDEERARTYAKILSNLEPVSSSTLRRILGHLHCLGQQSARNLMTVDNISAVWGPTLMHAGEKSAEDWNRSETRVVGDMIKLYPILYELSAADLAREAKILEVLERHHVSNNGPPRGAPSGDLKIWIHLLSRDGECVNVTIGPQKTASDVCKELSDKAKLPAHEICLEECTLGGALERPLHHSEKVLESVARWGYWDPDDRKDNILVLKRDVLYRDIAPRIKPPMTMSGELKFADTRTKNFKNYLFVFSQAKLCCYKDKMCSVKLHEWRIEDIVWYLGHEPKRNPQMGWSITFIVKNKKPTRCKETPYFGYTLAGASVVEQYKWLAAMIFGEYQMNLRPLAVNLMDT